MQSPIRISFSGKLEFAAGRGTVKDPVRVTFIWDFEPATPARAIRMKHTPVTLLTFATMRAQGKSGVYGQPKGLSPF